MRTLSIFSILWLLGLPALSANPESPTVTVPQRVFALPGGLDNVPVFNSNSPEVVQTEGILLSTFPPEGKATPSAHLNYQLNGRFDMFFHHIKNGVKENDRRALYLGCVMHNPSDEKVKVQLLEAASYTTRPDAPFSKLPPLVDNDNGETWAGPGDRVTTNFVMGTHQTGWPKKLTLKPNQTKVFFVRDISVRKTPNALNGRSGLVKLESDGPVNVAMLGSFGRSTATKDHQPKKSDWMKLLQSGTICGPRDKTPTPPGTHPVIYGRVAGVAQGSTWQIKDNEIISLPLSPGATLSYPLSTVFDGTLGTNQVQSAPMLVRYPDTAYEAHGNYAVMYDLMLPLTNASDTTSTFSLTLQTPLKRSNSNEQLLFFETPPEKVFLRGTVRFQYTDETGIAQDHAFHLVENQGMPMTPLDNLQLAPRETRKIRVLFMYPPDSTPPQVLTISSHST